MHGRPLINEQAFALIRRRGDNKNDSPMHLYMRRGLDLPADISQSAIVLGVHDDPKIPRFVCSSDRDVAVGQAGRIYRAVHRKAPVARNGAAR
jgi:hypothetical protein